MASRMHERQLTQEYPPQTLEIHVDSTADDNPYHFTLKMSSNNIKNAIQGRTKWQDTHRALGGTLDIYTHESRKKKLD